ncbi:sensor histidine kinase [Micromonospora sp. RP3T]|uniref:sensor histidine kinase n=1 Tax=Micromonospora sp. RP3T TaxID=2135446 RepID=UPI000D152609|nr:sensor histidine kinase [Micromonospora sp. RP3T]PTA45518.1 two-component sensor histidine kinase [Micromonospora sp. RP3T]
MTTVPALTSTARVLAWCLHLLVGLLFALAGLRAVVTGQPHAPVIAAVAAAGLLTYAAGALRPGVHRSRRAAGWWLAAVGVGWLALTVLTVDGLWLAFPLYLLQLHLLSRRAGPVAVAVTAVVAVVAFAAHRGAVSVAGTVGPVLGAAVAVAVVRGYQALYRESERRRRLIEELTATRADLARAQHEAGVAAERERLAAEIHDTLAQGLTSIQLLLRAAGRVLPDRPDTAARHVEQARQAAADNLAEARRFVAALTPPALDDTTLADALRRLCATTGARHRLAARFAVTGAPVPLPTAYEVALLRVAQAALANTVRHARATTVEVTLGYRADRVILDVTDDGGGFDPERLPGPGPDGGGFGLAAMRARTRALGGALTVAAAPGRGATVSARLPRIPSGGRP